MTEKSQEDRYQSAEEVIEDIEYIEKNIDLDFIKEYDNFVTQKIDQDKIITRSNRYRPNKIFYEENLSDYAKEEYEYDYEDDYYEYEKPVRKTNKKSNLNKKNKRKNPIKNILIILLLLVVIGGGITLGVSKLFNNTSSNTIIDEAFDVPNFTGQSIDDVSRQAAEYGLNIKQSEEYNADVKKGYVISQTPNTGKVKKGDTINVIVSLGGKEAVVPNCIGISYEKAKSLIEQNNLEVGSRKYEYSDTYEEGIVIWQNPSSGSSGILENTRIDLIISNGKEPKQTDESSEDDNNDINNDNNNNSGEEDNTGTGENNQDDDNSEGDNYNKEDNSTEDENPVNNSTNTQFKDDSDKIVKKFN